ncbi:MAG: RnfH family protein [Pseudomonadota bacterium]|nr:RnfH family protein [Pseudomonadota bacterium]
MTTSHIEIEVGYASPDVQRIVALRVLPGTTARAALRLSGLVEIFPEIDPDNCTLGIFGQVIIGNDSVLTDGDRVEVYRQLRCDPKEARRKRAALDAYESGDKRT